MSKLVTLVDPLPYTVSPEISSLAEKWILKEAYRLNYNIIQNQMTQREYKVEATQAYMRKKCRDYLEGIRDYTEILDKAKFNPTPKDVRIMTLLSHANVGERDFGKDDKKITWEEPYIIKNGQVEERLMGYQQLASAVKTYCISLVNSDYSNSAKGINACHDIVKTTLHNFIQKNFDVTNESEDLQDRSIIFQNKRLYFKDKLINIITSLGHIDWTYSLEDHRFEYDDHLFDLRFWNNICELMYNFLIEDWSSPDFKGALFKSAYKIKAVPCDNSKIVPYIPNVQKEKKTAVPQNEVVEITKEFIVLTQNRKCVYNNHTLVDITARIRISTPEGKIQWCTVPAAYCKQCDAYFVLEMDFENLRKRGVVLCPVIDKKTYLRNPSGIHQHLALNTESRIHQLGYNVNQNSDYTEKQRHLILANIMENTDITKYEIKSIINYNIQLRKNLPNQQIAIKKWKNDLAFISSYHIGDLPEVQVKKFVHGR